MISKIVRISLAILMSGLTLTALAQTAPATTPDAPSATPAAPPITGTRVATINIEQAIMASNEGRRDFENLSKKFEPKTNELKNLGDEIDSLKKQLSTQGDKMNEDAKAALVKQIEAKQKNAERASQDFREDAQAQQAELGQRILQKMVPVIQKYVSENGIGLLFDTSQQWPQGPVIMAGPAVDITQPIVEAYNVVSKVPAPAASAATKPSTPAAKPAPAAAKPAATAPPK
jgi:outer membrane protein